MKTHMTRIHKKLIGYKMFERFYDVCKVCLLNPYKRERMKKCIQQIMDQGMVQIGYKKKIEDLSGIESHRHIPFEILYQGGEAHASFQIPIPISS